MPRERGQGSVEYLLLASALILGVCLLARFATPVEDLAAALFRAMKGKPYEPRPRPKVDGGGARRPPVKPRRRGPRRPSPCVCPPARDAAADRQAAVARPRGP
jgi:hypothetical protein